MKSISEIIKQFEPISLGEMDEVRLLDRVDVKYLFHVNQLAEVLALSVPYYRILTISGLRYGKYETRYFDTPDYEMYTNHHNGKLNRYKIRFRTYVESNLNFFEIKFKTNTGRTRKSRIKYESQDFKIVGDSQVLLEQTTNYYAKALNEAIQINYNRITLVNRDKTERLTIDFNITDIYQNTQYKHPNLVIAEVKQDKAQRSAFIELMKSKHISTTSMSKYCLGIANCVQDVKINQFKSKLLYVNKLCNPNT